MDELSDEEKLLAYNVALSANSEERKKILEHLDQEKRLDIMEAATELVIAYLTDDDDYEPDDF